MRLRGDVHQLPLEDLAGADVKPGRPWLLVHNPPEAGDLHVFAYGTTQETEAVHGAAPLDIRWRRRSGHHADTRFFTARLRTESAEYVPERIGHARDRGDDIRMALRQSLGIGSGVAEGPGHAIQRGQIVSLSADVTDYLDGARVAVVMTEPRYAVLRRHQILLPIYSATDDEAQPGEIECDASWVRRLPGAPDRVVIAVPLIFTHSEAGRPRQPGGIVGIVPARADRETMDRIDEALITHLQL